MAGKKVKRMLAVLLAGAMVVSTAACGGNKDADTKSSTDSGDGAADQKTVAADAEEGALVVGIYGGLDSLNPWTSGRITKDMVTYVLYETLASCQSGSKDLDNILMKGYEKVDDNTFDVEIYDYIKDAEGNAITAADVVFSFEQYMQNWATTVEAVTAKDDYHVELKLNTTAAGAFEYIVCKVPIASEKAYNDSADQFASTSCGTLPYTVAGGKDYVNGTKIVARKTGTYWQTDESLIYPGSAANAEVIQFDILEEPTQMALAVEEGRIQFAQYIDPSLLDEVAAKDNLELCMVPSSEDRGIMLCMTEDSPFYDNLALRQAVLYAIDNEAVAEACGYGYGSPSIVTCGNADLTIGYDSSWETKPYDYDPDKARELLKEAGYDEGKLHLRLLCNNNKTITTMWQIIQANLLDVGIDAELNVCEGTTYGSYRDGTSGQYELAYAGPGNGGYVTSDLWNTLFNRKNYASGATWAGAKDDKLQELYDKIAAPDGYTQDNINAFYEYITDNAYYYRIYDLPEYAAYDKEAVSDYFVDWNRFIRANTIALSK
ncbi:ABC transporter substrate-binding protein [Faecalicatena orotica]|uniref:ABC-type transport system substrate-binding protein n=1 Tax=Faecalicatena orotica TaxID=1544 RepID=A0A2Y9BDI6_9FIRM|nr:ABC transporter substrate-binding protein [Faecalicatena orotica]PWJ29776.1 ABC-type transport system substrate-binding protein [Faecalicatena orotica]SSA55500.1 ABC-type transport system, substrate-binding protein [Faecalicatena orotica]